MNRKGILFLVVIMAVFLNACGSDSAPVEKQSFNMGTVITQKVYGKNAEKAVEDVKDRMAWIESTMTINAEGSEIDKLNDAAGKDFVKLTPESIFVMETANRFSELSSGAFDITVGPLVKAWGVFTENPRVPSMDEINRLTALTGYKDLIINKEELSAKLTRKGQIVDLGGIAKGYAGDEAIAIYKNHGIKTAFVNLGGNVVVLGSKPDGSNWRVGVQNPRAENGIYVGILQVKDKAVVSSGDYERFFEKDGVRYHHILDSKTGAPSNSDLMGTTIIADKSIEADALSTATFVLGLEKGMELIESLDGIEAVFVTKDKKVYTSSGLKDRFTFDDESREYQYVEKR